MRENEEKNFFLAKDLARKLIPSPGKIAK